VIAAGVDVAEEGKGLDLVVLDPHRRIVMSRGRLRVAEVGALLIDDLRPRIVCIDSPSGWARAGRSRASERALARLGHPVFYTGPDPGDHPFYRWTRVGMAVFAAVAPSYPLFRQGDPAGTAAEAYPSATARILAGRRPAVGESKVRFRRSVLAAAGVDAAALPNLDRVDAALAALTGLLALEGGATAVGDPEEGAILLPRGSLAETDESRRHSLAETDESRRDSLAETDQGLPRGSLAETDEGRRDSLAETDESRRHSF
jgi:predicted nuclease with RNAse H fold